MIFLNGCCALILCGLLLMGISLSISAKDNSDTSAEHIAYKVKAAYVYNFLRLIDWPDYSHKKTNSPMKICILGSDPFGELLDPIKKRTAKGRVLSIEFFSGLADEINNCHLVFICPTERELFKSVLSQIGNQPILTVSDLDGFAKHGGIIGFFMRNGKVRFEINLERARQADLQISARLLKVAVIIDK